MQFSLDRFYRINRRAVIWLALFGLLYILRDFFALIFVTFLIVSFTLPAINYLVRETRIPRTWIIVGMYLLILIGLVGLASYIVPRVVQEALAVSGEVFSAESSIERALKDLGKKYPTFQKPAEYLIKYRADFFSKDTMALQSRMQQYLGKAFFIAVATVSTILLSVLFAFLIVLDLTRLREQVINLGRSRLHDFYEQSAGPVVRFAGVLAESFRAQALIAVCNTILTMIGFVLLGIPKVALLAIIVFLFSFVPVLGVFISTAPAALVAMNSQGYSGAVSVILFVVVIHAVEAYVLNPLIYGRHLKLNPVLVILILYVGHHFFGLWGMLLGVPVAYYFIHYVFRVPTEGMTDAGSGNVDQGQAATGDAVIAPKSA